MEEKKWLVLVTNSITPYLYDIAQILALPKGAAYRFRYTEGWIKPQNLEAQSQTAIIVVRDFSTAELYPLRYAQVSKIERFGFIIYIEFIIGNYFQYSRDQAALTEEISDFNTKITDSLGQNYKNNPNDHMSPLVFYTEPLPKYIKANGSEFQNHEEYMQWGQILQILGKIKAYSSYSFLKISSLKGIGGVEYFCSRLQAGRKGYKIPGGTTFALDILQSVPYDPNAIERIRLSNKIELITENEVLPRIKSINYVVGCYDLLHFVFKSNVFKNDINTFFEILDYQESEKPGMVPINVPVTVEIGRLRKAIRWLRIILFFPILFAFILADNLAPLIHLDVNILRNLLVLGLAMCAGGFREILAKVPQMGHKEG